MKGNTGYKRSYGIYPYGDYRTNQDLLLFPISNTDSRMPSKERVHGIITEGETKVYQFSNFGKVNTVIRDRVGGMNVVVVGSRPDNFISSFLVPQESNFTSITGQGPIVMKDGEGNEYDAMGFVVNGPRKGSQLRTTTSMIGYWFSWGTFYPDCSIYSK